MDPKKSISGRFIGASMLLSAFLLVLLAVLLLAPFTGTVFSAVNDTFTANVTISNSLPNITQINFNDTDSSNVNISLNANNNTNFIWCNATINDGNGCQDITLVNATFFHTTSAISSADSKILHYTNATCNLTGSGTVAIAFCGMSFEHEATNGTWNCTIWAKDGALATTWNSTSNSVNQLIALDVTEAAIHFGTMASGQSSATANTTNVTNQGNVKINLQVAGSGDMICTAQGQIGVNNISYNLSSGAYTTMSTNQLSTSLSSALAFGLTAEGNGAFAADEPATNLTYWTIHIPTGVRGECNNTITISALMA